MKAWARILTGIYLWAGFSAAAMAAAYDIKQMTPEIEQAFQNRQGRYQELQSLKAQGHLGEDNRGYVYAHDPSAAGFAEAENSDRGVLYRAIVDQNALGPQGLAQVQAVFAEVQREKARPGDSIQLPDGTWVKK